MKTYFKHILSLSVFIAMTLSITAQDTLTLGECRSLALDHNKQLKAAHYKQQEAEMNQKVARTAYLPAINATGNVIHIPKDIENDGHFLPTAERIEPGSNEVTYTGESNVYSPGLSLTSPTLVMGSVAVQQPVFTGGKIHYSNKQADLGVEMTKDAYNLKHDEVIELIDNAFWQVAMVEANIELAESYITMLSELEDQMTQMYDLGLQPASEKLRVSVQKNEAELQLMKVRNGLKVTKMYLNQVIGRDLNTPINIAYDDPDTDIFDMSNGVDLALNNRYELKLLENQVKLSEYDKKIARSEYLPTIGVSAQYSTAYVKDIYENGGTNPMIAGQIRIPLFAWGQGSKKQKAAELVIKQKEEELSRTTDLISLEVLQIQVQVEEAFEAIIIARKNIDEAKESLDETKASFEVGLNTTTEMLNAQADWQKASSQLITAVASFKVLETKWAKATGMLNEIE